MVGLDYVVCDDDAADEPTYLTSRAMQRNEAPAHIESERPGSDSGKAANKKSMTTQAETYNSKHSDNSAQFVVSSFPVAFAVAVYIDAAVDGPKERIKRTVRKREPRGRDVRRRDPRQRARPPPARRPCSEPERGGSGFGGRRAGRDGGRGRKGEGGGERMPESNLRTADLRCAAQASSSASPSLPGKGEPSSRQPPPSFPPSSHLAFSSPSPSL
jgi:hypothetical protein